MSVQLCLSAGLWSAGTWPALTTGQERKLHHAIMKPVRIIHGSTWEDKAKNKTDKQLLIDTGGMAPVVLLRILRVMLLMRVCARAPLALLDWLIASREVASSWLATTLYYTGHLTWHSSLVEECRGWSLPQWTAAARNDQKGMRKSLLKAFQKLDQRGWMLTKMQASDIRHWRFLECGHFEQSSQALSVHMARSHGIKIEARRYACGSQCLSCLQGFHTRTRLFTHLAYRPSSCLYTLRHAVCPLSPDETEALDEIDRPLNAQLLSENRRITYADKLSVQLEGPMVESAFGDDGYSNSDPSLLHRSPVWRRCDQKLSKPKLPNDRWCLAAAFSNCSEACCLCRGSGLRDPG